MNGGAKRSIAGRAGRDGQREDGPDRRATRWLSNLPVRRAFSCYPDLAARRLSGRLLLVCLAIAFLSDSAFAQATTTTDHPDRGRDTGIFLSIGAAWDRVGLNFDERVTKPRANLASGTWGSGASFGIGYGLGPSLRLEMSVSVTGHDAHPAGTEGHLLATRLVGYVPLRTHGRLRPHLLGGFGFCAPDVKPADPPQRVYMVVSGDFGAGLRLLLSRHWSIQGDYAHSVLDIAKEVLIESGEDEMRDVGGTGWSDALHVHVSYDF